MNKYKIIFISPFSLVNKEDDNCDVNIVLETGEVYFGLLMTAMNVMTLLSRNNHLHYLNMVDTIIIKSMEKESIKNAIDHIVDEGLINTLFTQIGKLETTDFDYTFEELDDFHTWWKDA